MIIQRERAEMFAGWFRCLADPTRIQILSLLAGERRPMTVGEIVSAMDVAQSTVSAHLKRLAETGFAYVEHRGTASLFQVNEHCIECLPSAAELVMGEAASGALPPPQPGVTSRQAQREARLQPAASCEMATCTPQQTKTKRTAL